MESFVHAKSIKVENNLGGKRVEYIPQTLDNQGSTVIKDKGENSLGGQLANHAKRKIHL